MKAENAFIWPFTINFLFNQDVFIYVFVLKLRVSGWIIKQTSSEGFEYFHLIWRIVVMLDHDVC